MHTNTVVYGPITLAEAIAEHMPTITGTAYNVSKDRERLNDYAQAAYVACIERIAKCNGDFRQYCALTTVWTVRSIRKAELRERMKLGDNAALGSIFAAIPDRDMRRNIKQSFKKLTPAQKKTLRLHFAGKLESDVNSRKALSRARKALAVLMSQSA